MRGLGKKEVSDSHLGEAARHWVRAHGVLEVLEAAAGGPEDPWAPFGDLRAGRREPRVYAGSGGDMPGLGGVEPATRAAPHLGAWRGRRPGPLLWLGRGGGIVWGLEDGAPPAFLHSRW